MSAIENERTKLTAAALNTAATSSFTVGVLAPVAAAFYNLGGAVHVPVLVLMLGAFLWFTAAAALHMAARFVLGGLKP
mgnify:CR=1 FL=1